MSATSVALQGCIAKMLTTVIDDRVHYMLPVGDANLGLNALIGQNMTLAFTGKIHCTACHEITEKSHVQGHCQSCADTLASCDICRIKPELCHYDAGTCRQPAWGEANCLKAHYIYLSNTSGLKVGITRHTDDSSRWCDQGAVQALPILKVHSRLHSGALETRIAKVMADKTNWRTMLKGFNPLMDLKAMVPDIMALPEVIALIDELRLNHGQGAVKCLDEAPKSFTYPVITYPEKIVSLSFDKTPTVSGTLLGIKGQYLYFAHGVINLRKFTGYELIVSGEFSGE
jgi:hypothetical protein